MKKLNCLKNKPKEMDLDSKSEIKLEWILQPFLTTLVYSMEYGYLIKEDAAK